MLVVRKPSAAGDREKVLILRVFSLLVLHFLLTVAPLQAQSPASLLDRSREVGLPYLTNFTPRAYGGVPQNWSIVQDARGLIYVANHARILEYDGVTWRHIASDAQADFMSLALDSVGTLYVGAVGDLGYLAPDRVGQLHFVSLLDQISEAYRDFDHVWRVAVLPDGIYFHTHKYLFRWSGSHFDTWEAGTRFEQSVVGRQSFYVRREGTGLMHVVGDSLRLAPGGDLFADEGIYVMVPYAADTLLVGSRTQGLFFYDGRSFTPFATRVNALLEGAQLYSGAVFNNGSHFALGTLKSGVIIIDRQGNPLRVFDKAAGLLDQQVHFIHPDPDGALWMSFNNGLARVDGTATFTSFGDANGLPGTVNAVLRHQGTLYAATSQGVYYLDGTGSRSGVPLPHPVFRRFANFDSFTLALLSVDEILMATTTQGVHLIGNGGDRLVEADWFWPVSLYRSRYHPDRIYAGLSDGLAILEEEGGTWVDRGQVPEIRGDIRSFAEEDGQTLWVGTARQGVWRVMFGQVGVRTQRFHTTNGLPEGGITVHSVRRRVLFATDRGLYRFEPATERSLPDTSLGAIFADTLRKVQDVVEGSDGVVYIQSMLRDRMEVYQAVPGIAGTYVLDKTPFLPLADRRQIDHILPETNGTIWFGGPDGIVRYHRDVALADRKPYPALIRQVSTIRGDSVIFAGGGSGSAESDALPVLAYPDNALRFDFAAAVFDEAVANNYQFRLDGFEETWSEWTTETRKDYTNLPEGSYRFRVRARDTYEEIGSEASFAFILLPPWYRTWWAYLIYGLAAVLALAGLDHVRRRRMVHKTVALEAVVEARTAEVRARNEDLREQKRIIEEQAERLRELDVLKNRFFANVSHEFRTPLTLTIGPLEDLLDRETLSDEVAADLDMALRNARRLLRLTNQILDIAKLEAGQMALQHRRADFGTFAENIALAFTPLAERKNIAYRIDTRPAAASFDPDQFEKVVINLLSNAFKFTPEGGTIRLHVAVVEDRVNLVVRNSGPGIPADELPHLFERFYQADGSSTRVQPGTGIGLALVKELVELHGGTVSVESEEGFGTTVTVALPRAEAVEGEGPQASRTVEAQTLVDDLLEEAASGDGSLVKGTDTPALLDGAREDEAEAEDVTTVLVVDDNAEVRAFIRRRLESRYRIVEAADGRAGLDAARGVLPDLILSDVMMPEMDGYAFCRALKADPALDYLPVILLTAKASAEAKIEGLHEGADDYLTKPFDARELEARVENLIASRRRLQARFSAHSPTLRATPVEATSTDDAFLERVREVVEAHLADPDFSVERLAEEVGLSRVHLYRRLRDVLDQSPMVVIRTLRLERAADLLRQRAGSVGEVAYGVGFKSVSHFSQCFREHFDMTPSAYLAQASADQA